MNVMKVIFLNKKKRSCYFKIHKYIHDDIFCRMVYKKNFKISTKVLKKRERKNIIKNKIKLILIHLKLYLVLPLDFSKCIIEKIKTDELF